MHIKVETLPSANTAEGRLSPPLACGGEFCICFFEGGLGLREFSPEALGRVSGGEG